MVEWTTETDEAFQRIKELLESLPMVTAPIKGETLIRYLAASEESISAVLMAERGKKQVLVYFQGAKDEEAKRKEPEPEKAWKLFTDGVSSSDGSGAGLILVSPEGKEYTNALRLEFEITNNEAEYEALLAGLRIANEMKVQELTIFVDSQLVANQVNGLFEARDQNKKADALSKLALMTFSKLAKEVIVEVIQDKSITQREVADVTREKEDSRMIPIREIMDGNGYLPKDLLLSPCPSYELEVALRGVAPIKEVQEIRGVPCALSVRPTIQQLYSEACTPEAQLKYTSYVLITAVTKSLRIKQTTD
ncbi:reverse transcriptase domain-containing protein [Tanacetum coccineum]